MNARKDDTTKPRMDLIPPEAFIALGVVLKHGADKYGERNWEGGLHWGRVTAALLRHLTAWMAGEDTDPESGTPHTWHLLTNAAFLVASEARGIGIDNRTPATAPVRPAGGQVVASGCLASPDAEKSARGAGK